jgi:hypothetical protein
MQKLEVLIEESAFGVARPVEMVADAPISVLIPALVEELRLSPTDIFGNSLVYVLRDTASGTMLPEHMTLREVGIQPGARLALDSYVMGDSGATLMQQTQFQYAAPDAEFHTSATVADQAQMPALSVRDTSSSLAAVKKQKRAWSRRAFLLASGAVLGAGGVGLGYAAYQAINHGLFLQTHKAALPSPATTVAPMPAQAPLPKTAKQVFTFTGHHDTVRVVSWSSDGMMLASGANDARLMTWDLKGTVHLNIHHDTTVQSLAWSPDGQRIVTGAGSHITFFDAQNGRRLAHFTQSHTAPVTSLAWTPHNQMQVVSGSQDQRAIVWNTTKYMPTLVFRLHTAAIESVSWASDGQTVASASLGGAVRIWNAENGQEVHSFYLDAQLPMRAAAFAPAGAQLAIGGDDGIIRLWHGLTCQHVGTGQFGLQCMDVPQRFQASAAAIHSLAWSPDGRFLLAGSDDGTFTVWYPSSSQKPLVSMRQNDPVLSVAWSPASNQQIATASGQSVAIWNLM